jgi:RND family efflux transporter MFP subunit
MKKFFTLLVILIIIAALGYLAYQRISVPSAAGGRHSTAAVAVETQPVKKDALKDIGVFTGSLLPKSKFEVAPKVSGWLKQILVNIGDTVSQNQVIAVLDDEEFTRQVEQAGAELRVAQANVENCTNDLEQAKRDYERAKTLREKQIASDSELEASEAALKASQSQLTVSQAQAAQKEAAYKTAELRLSYTKVSVFWEDKVQTRIVGERFVDEGTLLQANQPIVTILDNSTLIAVVYAVEKDYPKIKIGQKAIINTDAYPETTFSGYIVRIAPILQESSRQARVEIETPNTNQLLKPGMFVRANIEFANKDNATIVPLASIVKRNEKQGVFIADQKNRKAHFIPITTGIINGELVEILEPEITGLVVTIGNHLLEDGSDIILPTQESSSTTPELKNETIQVTPAVP